MAQDFHARFGLDDDDRSYIHCTPKRSTHMPKYGPHGAFASGIVTLPPVLGMSGLPPPCPSSAQAAAWRERSRRRCLSTYGVQSLDIGHEVSPELPPAPELEERGGLQRPRSVTVAVWPPQVTL